MCGNKQCEAQIQKKLYQLHLNMNTLESTSGKALLSYWLPNMVGELATFARRRATPTFMPQFKFCDKVHSTVREIQRNGESWPHTTLTGLKPSGLLPSKCVSGRQSPKICDRIYSCSLLMKNPAVLRRG